MIGWQPEKEHKAEKRPESQSSTKSKFSLNTADAAEVEESLVTKKEPEKVFWPVGCYTLRMISMETCCFFVTILCCCY